VTGLSSGLSSGASAAAPTMVIAATIGSLTTFAMVYPLAWQRGLDADQLVLTSSCSDRTSTSAS